MSNLNNNIKEKLLENKELIVSAVKNFEDHFGYSIFLKDYTIENISKFAELEFECVYLDEAKEFEINFELLDSTLFTVDDVYQCEIII